MKIFKIVLITIAGLIAVMIAVGLLSSIGMGEIKKLVINDVDLAKISDGVYQGAFHKGRWTYDARVTVKDHRIAEVVNTNKSMEKARTLNEKIAEAILKKQSPRIDVVSGASVHTRAFEKAVENALSAGVAGK
jgi:uncharacterized protein with FMN-binding domain